MIFHNKKGFTLTEVLLATAIVGIIAALVIPPVVRHYSEALFEDNYKRELQAIKGALDGLVVTENKQNFGQTMMYTMAEEPDNDATVGLFLKKYLKIVKYFGDAETNKDTIKAQGFASKYYEYSDGDKKEISIDDYIVGACVRLKNGATLCLTPQKGQNPLSGIIDMNGPKGPNVMGRDLRRVTGNDLPAVKFSSFDLLSKLTEAVATEENPNIAPDEENPCLPGAFDTACCTYRMNKGSITSDSDVCCDNSEIMPLVPACAKSIELKLNVYPSSCLLKESDCNVYLKPSQTDAKSNGSLLTTLPATPPNVYLFCEGVYAGMMSGTDLKRALEGNSSADADSVYFYMARGNGTAETVCGYPGGTHQGLQPVKSSVVFDTSGTWENYSSGSYKWTVRYF